MFGVIDYMQSRKMCSKFLNTITLDYSGNCWLLKSNPIIDVSVPLTIVTSAIISTVKGASNVQPHTNKKQSHWLHEKYQIIKCRHIHMKTP